MGLISTIVYKPNCVQLKQPVLDCWEFLDECAPESTKVRVSRSAGSTE